MGRLLPLSKILPRLAAARRRGETVVTTNGCFDLFHAGHAALLRGAKARGDVLAVGVNRDAAVRKQKGPGRPRQGQKTRARAVAADPSVDYVFIFHEPDPRKFLARIRPDVHVKGGDYTLPLREQAVVEKHGGRVHLVPLVPGISTTARIQGMRTRGKKK
jgi:glycerol-3-phosphate cytidylyltransferase